MDWGNKLVVAFVSFAALMGTLVYKSMHTKYELVTKDYYKDELKYQDRIDAKNAAANIGEVTVLQQNDSIKVLFPKELANHTIKGKIWFYCSTNETNDKQISFDNVVNNQFTMAIHNLHTTNYQAKISYQSNNVSYYSEKDFIVH
jgi:hypothetical protein